MIGSMTLATAMRDSSVSVDVDRETTHAASMDEDEFRIFYDRTARPLWAYLTRMTGDPELAEDLLQDAYYRLLRARASYESELHRRNALFRIATNLARDNIRRARRATHIPMPDNLEAITSAADERRGLAEALEKLKPLQREILWLAYGQGSSHAEIAEIVGMSGKSIKSLLFRARRRLAELLHG